MILYHGSNVEIEAIDFSKSKPGKDFGVGFYLSPDENQALEMAEKKARLLGGAPIVTRYEFDEEAVKADSVAYLRYAARIRLAHHCTPTTLFMVL